MLILGDPGVVVKIGDDVVELVSDLGTFSGGTGVAKLMYFSAYAPHRAEKTCAHHNSWLFLASFSVIG